LPQGLAVLVVAAASLFAVPGAGGSPTDVTIKPVVTGTLGANGWYTSNVTITWNVSGATDSSGCDTKTLTADTKGTTLTCTASDPTSTITVTKTFKIDKTPPTVTAGPSRAADANGWYNHALTVVFSGTDATAGIDSCSSTAYGAPDTPSASVPGSCTDLAGNVGRATFAFKFDKTPPAVTPAPSRPPDANGWYNHPVAVGFAGADATSGVAVCSSTNFSGAPDPKASVPGSCMDVAGNVGAAAFSLAYDATPPTLTGLTATAGNRRVDLTWTASPDTTAVDVTRTPGPTAAATKDVYRGTKKSCRDTGLKIGKAYRYTVTGVDQAGNTASATLAVTATGLLFSPVPRARVSAPPLLVWAPVKRARYYNVQLVRGRKILSVWPTRTYFQVPRSWTFKGHRYRLKPGVYHWYVWPGFGKVSAGRYGRSLGGSSFIVTGR
jgi:hypothetical protein